jgi:hypothetical protein
MDFLTSQIVANICEIIIAFFTAFMALGIWYARNSLEEQRKQVELQSWNMIFELWGREKELRAREFVLKDFDFSQIDKLDSARMHDVKMVLATCNRISMFVLEGLIDDKKLISFIGVSMLKIWEKTKDFIKWERQQNSKHYMYHFEKFIERYEKSIRKLG